MSYFYKRRLPALIVFIIAVLLWFNYFTGELASPVNSIKAWVTPLHAFSAVLAAGYFYIRGVERVKKREPHWYLSIWSMALACIFILVGLAFTQTGSEYGWLSDYILIPASRVAFLPIFFPLVTIMSRAYTIRNLSTAFFIGGAVVAHIVSTPYLTSFTVGKELSNWYWQYARATIKRAITFGEAGSAIALVVRQIAGIGRRKEEKPEEA